MKKMFFALAALVLAFTGCSQEEDAIQVSEKKAVKVVVNMDKPGFGEDTRAARQGWEGDEEVVVVLGNYFGAYVHLYYEYYSREWQASYYKYDGEEFDAIYAYKVSEFIGNLKTKLGGNGNLKAIYLSSGEVYAENGDSTPATRASNPEQDVTLLADVPETLSIVSDAVEEGKGECIMTCEDGSFEISGNEEDGYVLALNIMMVPQVAQFTIRHSDPIDMLHEVLCVGGALTAYCGATLTSEGFVLNAAELDELYGCWPHANEDGVSIYASPWTESKDGIEKGTFKFGYWNDGGFAYSYIRTFTGKTELENGDAVIMDGPFIAGGASKWSPWPDEE